MYLELFSNACISSNSSSYTLSGCNRQCRERYPTALRETVHKHVPIHMWMVKGLEGYKWVKQYGNRKGRMG